jgi:hypothetical protein
MLAGRTDAQRTLSRDELQASFNATLGASQQVGVRMTAEVMSTLSKTPSQRGIGVDGRAPLPRSSAIAGVLDGQAAERAQAVHTSQRARLALRGKLPARNASSAGEGEAGGGGGGGGGTFESSADADGFRDDGSGGGQSRSVPPSADRQHRIASGSDARPGTVAGSPLRRSGRGVGPLTPPPGAVDTWGLATGVAPEQQLPDTMTADGAQLLEGDDFRRDALHARYGSVRSAEGRAERQNIPERQRA